MVNYFSHIEKPIETIQKFILSIFSGLQKLAVSSKQALIPVYRRFWRQDKTNASKHSLAVIVKQMFVLNFFFQVMCFRACGFYFFGCNFLVEFAVYTITMHVPRL